MRIISAREATRTERRQYENGPRQDELYEPSLTTYLDDHVHATFAATADAKGVELSVLVNELLKKDIELIQTGR